MASGTPRLRPEELADATAIADTIAAAFGRPEEALLVARLREAGALTVSIVAEVDGGVVGHVALSPVTVDAAEGGGRWLGLAPLAVRPEHQRRGIGAALVTAALAASRAQGAAAVFVLGDPGYYDRLGFAESALQGWGCIYPVPSPAFRVHRLDPDAAPPSGTVRYHPAFDAL
jgi:putative acetyltransferase